MARSSLKMATKLKKVGPHFSYWENNLYQLNNVEHPDKQVELCHSLENLFAYFFALTRFVFK